MFETNRNPLQMCYVPCSVFDRNIVKRNAKSRNGDRTKIRNSEKQHVVRISAIGPTTPAMIFFTFLSPAINLQIAHDIIKLPFQTNIYHQCRKSGNRVVGIATKLHTVLCMVRIQSTLGNHAEWLYCARVV